MTTKKEIENKVDIITKKYVDTLDFDMINRTIKLTNNQDIGTISKKVIQNIARWSLNGASEREVRENLALTEYQFKTLCALCPVVTYVMQDGLAMAEMLVASSILETAIGGKMIKKIRGKVVDDYENGKKVGQHVEMVTEYDELPPNKELLMYIAEHKLSQKFGKDKGAEDKATERIVATLDTTQLEQVEKMLNERS